jgi:hypothetical protein
MNIKSNSVLSSNGLNSVNLPNSISIGSSLLNVYGNIHSGIITTTTLNANSLSATTVTSSNFVGDGSQLSGLETTTVNRIIALRYIFADPPLRS